MTRTLLTILGAELRRTWRRTWSYRFDTLGEMIMWLVAFPLMMVLFGGVAGEYGPEARSASLIGFLVWDLCLGVPTALTQDVSRESREGTLETLFLAPLSPTVLFSLRILAAFLIQLVRTLALGLILVVLLGLSIGVSGSAFLVLALTVAGAYGVGLMLAGVALVHKEVAGLVGTLSLLAVLATGALVPLNSLGALFTALRLIVPTTWGIDALRAVMLGSEGWGTLWADGTWLGLSVQALAFVGLGVLVFRRGIVRARIEGTLGSY